MLTSAPGGVGGQGQVPVALTPGPFWMNTVKTVPCSQRSSNTEQCISGVWRIAIPITPPHRHGRLRYFVPKLNEALLSNNHLERPRNTSDSTGAPRFETCQARLLHYDRKTSRQDSPNLCCFTVCVDEYIRHKGQATACHLSQLLALSAGYGQMVT
jgi:hypothetical protein